MTEVLITHSDSTEELAQLSEELKGQRDSMSKLREELRKTRSDYDELQVRYDDEVFSGGAWKKERERLETKILISPALTMLLPRFAIRAAITGRRAPLANSQTLLDLE